MKIPLTDYEAGAAFATALVCTSPTVRAAEGEALDTPDSLAHLLAGHHLRPDAVADGRALTADDLDHVRLLRREARAILETGTEEHAVAGAAVLTARAGLAPVLLRDAAGRWQWHVPTAPGAPLVAELAAFIGVALFGVVRTLGHDRFRACAASGCRGVFADTSRAGRRRYCRPGVCGNRLNVANHRARLRAEEVTR